MQNIKSKGLILLKRSNLSILIIVIGVQISILLLIKSDFFKTYDVQVFSNVITPIATILAFAIYYLTLIELKKSNVKTINFQRINLFKERIENLRISLENTKVDVPIYFEDKFEDLKKCNLTNFYKGYSKIHMEMLDKISQGETDVMPYSMFVFGICFQFSLSFKRIESLLKEIIDSKFDDLEKSILNESIIKILNDYLLVSEGGSLMRFNYTDSKKNTIQVNGFDAPFYSIPQNKQTTVFKYMEFNRVYQLMKSNDLI